MSESGYIGIFLAVVGVVLCIQLRGLIKATRAARAAAESLREASSKLFDSEAKRDEGDRE